MLPVWTSVWDLGREKWAHGILLYKTYRAVYFTYIPYLVLIILPTYFTVKGLWGCRLHVAKTASEQFLHVEPSWHISTKESISIFMSSSIRRICSEHAVMSWPHIVASQYCMTCVASFLSSPDVTRCCCRHHIHIVVRSPRRQHLLPYHLM